MNLPMLKIVPAVCIAVGLSLAAAQEPAGVLGKWADAMVPGISFEFRENKMGVMTVFGVDSRFVWQQKEKTILMAFPPEKDIHKAMLDKDGKTLKYFGKKETITPELTMRRVK